MIAMREEKSLAYEVRVVLLLGLAYGFAFFDRQTMSFLAPSSTPPARCSRVWRPASGRSL
jgi:hypothetical protein